MPLIEILVAVIMAVPSSGSPNAAAARKMATEFVRCAERLPDIDAWHVAALAWEESGFRLDAVLAKDGKPRMLGILQLNERWLPADHQAFNLKWHMARWCSMVEKWAARHRSCPPGSHHLLAHHFGGYRVSKAARAAAIRVLERRRRLLNRVIA